MMMFETLKHVPKSEKRCCVFKDNLTEFSLKEDFSSAEYQTQRTLICLTFPTTSGSLERSLQNHHYIYSVKAKQENM